MTNEDNEALVYWLASVIPAPTDEEREQQKADQDERFNASEYERNL